MSTILPQKGKCFAVFVLTLVSGRLTLLRGLLKTITNERHKVKGKATA